MASVSVGPQPDTGFIEAVEAFCADHGGISIKEVLTEWDRELFDIFYVAFKRRKAVEALDARRITMTAALFANSAFYKVESGQRDRDAMIKQFNESCDDIMVRIYDARTDAEIEAAESEDPFIAAINLNQSIVETDEQKAERKIAERRH